jgi:hypothetical protein
MQLIKRVRLHKALHSRLHLLLRVEVKHVQSPFDWVVVPLVLIQAIQLCLCGGRQLEL